jgi:hypothetical protein
MNFNDEQELALWALRPFQSRESEMAAFSDPRYSRSEIFRAAIAAKLAISDNGIPPTVHRTTTNIEVIDGVIGARTTEAGVQLAEDLKVVEQEMADEYGRTSVAPAPTPAKKELTVREASQWK